MGNLRPVGDKIVVIPEPRADEHEGLVLPSDRDEGLQEPEFGIVLAVGPGVQKVAGRREGIDIKRGDRVCYRKYDHHEYEINGETVKILSASSIFFVADRSVALGVAGL